MTTQGTDPQTCLILCLDKANIAHVHAPGYNLRVGGDRGLVKETFSVYVHFTTSTGDKHHEPCVQDIIECYNNLLPYIPNEENVVSVNNTHYYWKQFLGTCERSVQSTRSLCAECHEIAQRLDAHFGERLAGQQEMARWSENLR